MHELLVFKSLYPVSGSLVSAVDESIPRVQLPECRCSGEGLWLVSQGRAGSWECRIDSGLVNQFWPAGLLRWKRCNLAYTGTLWEHSVVLESSGTVSRALQQILSRTAAGVGQWC